MPKLPAIILTLCCLDSAVAAEGDRLRLTEPAMAIPAGASALELAGGGLASPAVLGGIVRLRADAPGRVLGGSILTGTIAPSPPEGVFAVGAMRAVSEDDWRATQRIAGRCTLAAIHLPGSAWGTPAQRKAWSIPGSDADWDQVGVQIDGWLHVTVDGTTVSTRSDDGSRLWLDLDNDGGIGVGEWGSNNWGGGQGATTRPVHARIRAGCYRFRLQAEDGGGPNCISLLWDDATHSNGAFGGLHIVPASAFARPSWLTLDGVQPLALTAIIGGPGGLVIDGPVVEWRAGASCAGPLRVAHGRLRLAADLVVDELQIAAEAVVELAGHRLRVRHLDAAGTIAADGGTLAVVGAADSRLARFDGAGALIVDGGGTLRLDRADGADLTLRSGVVLKPERALSAVSARVLPGLGADLPLALPGPGPFALDVEITVPADAPADLGILAYARDRHDRWHQQARQGILAPGRHRLRFDFGPDAAAAPAVGDAPWNPDAATACTRAGVRLWSVAGGGTVQVHAETRPVTATPSSPRLLALRSDGPLATTSQRWELSCLPEPFPADPYDPEAFALSAEFTGPDGRRETVNGFHMVEAVAVDGGDRVRLRSEPRADFRLRWRPRLPGAWTCRLSARWAGGATSTIAFPLTVGGAPWDGYLRVDRGDPRFFSVDGAFAWPLGVNLHAVTDDRAREVLGTRPAAQRGVLAYEALVRRFSAAGADLAEVWMAAWNLGIEWGAHRPGFLGAGRYGQGQAAQLDALLDTAWAHGMRIVLATNHLGQGSDWCAPEWPLHPFHRANGGWLEKADDLFTDPRALAFQDRYRRYVIARWGDHPAVACWKIWTEIDLTNMRGNTVAWHDRASRRWRELDPYGHPVTTHWSGTYRVVAPAVVALPGIDFATIDAYHGSGSPLAELLQQSTLDPAHGLARLGKPVLCTEYGVNWNGGPREQLLAETMSAPFAGLVSGHAGAPMCWWFERLDQDAWFDGFRAMRRVLTGIDLRGGAGVALTSAGESPAQISGAAWVKPGRMVGYAIDRAWAAAGGEVAERAGVQLIPPGEAAGGTITVTWRNADTGEVVRTERLGHAGGRLVLSCPPWRRHIVFTAER